MADFETSARRTWMFLLFLLTILIKSRYVGRYERGSQRSGPDGGKSKGGG